MSEKRQCAEKLFRDYHHYPCVKPATVERDGKWYCGTHDPVKVAAKDAARSAALDAKWKAEHDEQEAKAEAERLIREIVVALARGDGEWTATARRTCELRGWKVE